MCPLRTPACFVFSVYMWQGNLMHLLCSLFSVQDVRGDFYSIMQLLKLQSFEFYLYGIRRGGATTLWSAGMPFEHIMVMGRWRDFRSCRLYLEEGRAISAVLDLSNASNTLCYFFSDALPDLVNQAG